MKQRYISKTHNARGNKHPGIYNQHKEIAPTPKRILIARFSLPNEYANAIQELYPNLSIHRATKQYILDTVLPKNLKEL